MEYTDDVRSWRQVLRRATGALPPGRRGRKPTVWSIGTPVIALAAGLLFTTSATTAAGTALREDRRPQLAQLIEDERDRVEAAEERADALRDDVRAQTDAQGSSNSSVQAQNDRAGTYEQRAGFTALGGPGMRVVLDDAPHTDATDGATNDDLVVHQGDVQAVVNAMWAGGAEAMSIMGVRVISTSAVRCVGNTLLLHGRNYSPPFEIIAIGDPESMRASLASSSGVQAFRQAVADYGLGYRETVEGNTTVPAYDGSTALRSADVPG
ncbi:MULTISPECIES: DUF881 domain-containing protein [Catenuloplanes]|uniref:Uncharacterized protein YlxW (UPF0749 family) n=1 Tax=Catenuloplanes niger TaxID=587534 RepID=A0AAE3ZQC6_9ACTN|nr:DUF881 domain-containing protein [Catenuloplanes niger]MDR7323626.1 uncharacterized protein YlxW (UPF0749 family) [Catenuloplanes niger]